MDLPVDENCERTAYQGPKTNPDRISYTLENFKIWRQIYDRGFKFDIFYIDNCSMRTWLQAYTKLYSILDFTNSYLVNWNRNPIDYMTKNGGEKSGIVLPYKFMAGGMADHLGYDAILHWNMRYTPDLDYDYNTMFEQFMNSNLDLLITPSRYGKPGFNTNCMMVKPIFWREWSRTWNYHPERSNCEMEDVYESLQAVGMIGIDNSPDQPYSKIDLKRMRINTAPPYEWYRRETKINLLQTELGYEVVRK